MQDVYVDFVLYGIARVKLQILESLSVSFWLGLGVMGQLSEILKDLEHPLMVWPGSPYPSISLSVQTSHESPILS